MLPLLMIYHSTHLTSKLCFLTSGCVRTSKSCCTPFHDVFLTQPWINTIGCRRADFGLQLRFPKFRARQFSSASLLMSGRSWDGRPVSDFAVLHPHVDIAQKHWSAILNAGDTAIDATAGNGHDTLHLVRLLAQKGGGRLISCDIQESAISASQSLLREKLDMDLIESDDRSWLCTPTQADTASAGTVTLVWNRGCHLELMKSLEPKSVKLVVFNLGYLPGGDKQIVTTSDITVATLQHSSEAIEKGGCISVTCYPGHDEGEREETSVVEFATNLSQKYFSSYWHQWINQRNKKTGKRAPSLVLIQAL